MPASRVLITGAGGFLGSRLAHCLSLSSEKHVTGLVHSPAGANAMRLARLPIRIEHGSIRDPETIRALANDVDTIVNCAFGMGKTSVDGTRTLLQEAESAGVENFVHLSSAVVHGHDFEGTLDETASFSPDTEYGEWKVKGEEVIEDYRSRLSFDPTIFRPFIIYGPHSHWILDALSTVKHGAILADGGSGTLNQIYIDNLVHAIQLAIDEPEAAGETFMIADDEAVTWRDFYEEIGRLLGSHPPVKSLTSRQIIRQRKAQLLRDSVLPPLQIPKRIVSSREVRMSVAGALSKTPWAGPALERVPESMRSRIINQLKNGQRPDLFDHDEENVGRQHQSELAYKFPENRLCTMQSTHGQLSTSRAKSILDWEPQITFTKSMALIDDWISYENIFIGEESFA